LLVVICYGSHREWTQSPSLDGRPKESSLQLISSPELKAQANLSPLEWGRQKQMTERDQWHSYPRTGQYGPGRKRGPFFPTHPGDTKAVVSRSCLDV
jgi:hypothetical protein